MSVADPYVVQIPEVLVNRDGTLTAQAKAWFEYDNRWKHDLWQQAGGGIDLFADFEVRINENYQKAIIAYAQAVKSNVNLNPLINGSDAIGLHTHNKEIAARVALRI